MDLSSMVIWWKELLRGDLNSGISDNKVVASSSSVPVFWRDAGHSLLSVSDTLRRRKAEEDIFGTGTFNKRCYLQNWFFLLAGLGDDGEEENSLVAAGVLRWRINFMLQMRSLCVLRQLFSSGMFGRRYLRPRD